MLFKAFTSKTKCGSLNLRGSLTCNKLLWEKIETIANPKVLQRIEWRGCAWTLGKWEPSWKPGESGYPARQEGEKMGNWHRTVEEDRHHKMPQKLGDGLATTPSYVYAESTYHCALCINYRTNNQNRNHVFIVLFVSG